MDAREKLNRYFEMLVEAPEGSFRKNTGTIWIPTTSIPSIEAGVKYSAAFQAVIPGGSLAAAAMLPNLQGPVKKALKRIRDPIDILDPQNIENLTNVCSKALKDRGRCFPMITEVSFVTLQTIRLYPHKLLKQITLDMRENVIASLEDEFFHRDWWRQNRNPIIDGKVWGIVLGNGRVIGMCDAPEMPFMRDEVAEITYQTHKEYRGHGLGKAMVSHACKFFLDRGVVPFAAVASTNIGSKKVIRACGGMKYADVLSLRIKAE